MSKLFVTISKTSNYICVHIPYHYCSRYIKHILEVIKNINNKGIYL